MKTHAVPGRRMTLALAGLLALASTIVVLAVSGEGEGHAADHSHPAAATTSKSVAFRGDMRELWEQHVAWTRLAIVGFAGNLPNLPATEQRLLHNQTDIGNAIKPFYGKAAGNKLTKLLKAHITGAVALLEAAQAGDAAKLAQAKSAWYTNGNQISDFLSSANPHNWPREAVRAMMKTHLDQTLAEGVDELTGKYAAGVHQYDAIEHHILEMADTLSSGIVKQFPARFR